MSQSPTPTRSGILCIVSGPSGSGKTTICRKLNKLKECAYSISCTTRKPREGEINGTDYHFLNEDEFVARIAKGDFLEHAHVHGKRYGTLKSTVTDHLNNGTDVVMDIDVQGAALVRDCEDPFIREALVDIFILPPTREELLNRLTGRGTESKEEVALRMKNSIGEINGWDDYTYTIISSSQEADLANALAILTAERQRSHRANPHIVEEIKHPE